MSNMTQQEKASAVRHEVTVCWDGVDENNSESPACYYMVVTLGGTVVALGSIWHNPNYPMLLVFAPFNQQDAPPNITLSEAKAMVEERVLAGVYDALVGEEGQA